MSIIREKDLVAFKLNLDKLEEAIKKARLDSLEPTLIERQQIMEIIKKYIRDKQRKIYGGYALNALVASKNAKEAFYKPLDTPDIEFYSPEPLVDLIAICDTFAEQGFKYVSGKEAVHEETYTVFVNMEKFCDISYVPRNIYNRIPYLDLDGFRLTDPSFMTIDVLRALSDMMTSGWRVKKTVERGYLLFKHYPMREPRVTQQYPIPSKKTQDIRRKLYLHLQTKKTTVLIGYAAVEYYQKLKLATPDKVPYFDVISEDFREDCLEIIEFLMQEIGKVEIQEFYPFFQFTNHRLEIKWQGETIINIYHANHKCLPFKIVKTAEGGEIKMGSFHLTMLYAYVMFHGARTIKDKDVELIWRQIIFDTITARNKWLQQHNKTSVDNTPYQDYIIDCLGPTMDLPRYFRLKIEKKKSQPRRGAYIFSYTPNAKKPDISRWRFANTSGNAIRNPKNRRIRVDGLDTDEKKDELSVDDTIKLISQTRQTLRKEIPGPTLDFDDDMEEDNIVVEIVDEEEKQAD